MDLVIAVVGLAILLGAGDALVRGAVALALKLGIPALLVSLTIVAFGTSAPELLISVQSALDDAPGIAFGNVVGSNIANVLLVLGVPAMLKPIDARECDTRRNYVMMGGATLLFAALLWTGPLYWPQGLLLLALLGAVLWDAWRTARDHRRAAAAAGEIVEDDLPEEIAEADPHMAIWKIALFLGLGLAGLPLGAHLLIEGARGVALAAGVSEAAIGLTLVALGTSLPELATTIMAALRRQADVALGNVIGSNIFNILAIMGVASFFGPLEVPTAILTIDLWVMIAAAALLAPFVAGWVPIARWMGAAMTALYVLYAWVALTVAI